MKKQFKTLFYINGFVDQNMLSKGIYFRKTPIIYDKDLTIEKLIEYHKKTSLDIFREELSNEYLENLSKCELKLITITYEKN